METADKTIASGDNGGAVSMSPPAPCSAPAISTEERAVLADLAALLSGHCPRCGFPLSHSRGLGTFCEVCSGIED